MRHGPPYRPGMDRRYFALTSLKALGYEDGKNLHFDWREQGALLLRADQVIE